MSVEAFLWVLLPVFIAVGSSLLSFFVMQAKLDVAVSQEREIIAKLQAQLQAQQQSVEDKVHAAEEGAKRSSFDNFLADIRVEERHYVRESKFLSSTKRAMVLQERMYFRNLPLSNWVEHEMTIEEGGDLIRLAKAASVFSGAVVASDETDDLPSDARMQVGPRLVRKEPFGGLLVG
jgi:outer membrane murein-binding lipoprotein Lpp